MDPLLKAIQLKNEYGSEAKWFIDKRKQMNDQEYWKEVSDELDFLN